MTDWPAAGPAEGLRFPHHPEKSDMSLEEEATGKQALNENPNYSSPIVIKFKINL